MDINNVINDSNLNLEQLDELMSLQVKVSYPRMGLGGRNIEFEGYKGSVSLEQVSYRLYNVYDSEFSQIRSFYGKGLNYISSLKMTPEKEQHYQNQLQLTNKIASKILRIETKSMKQLTCLSYIGYFINDFFSCRPSTKEVCNRLKKLVVSDRIRLKTQEQNLMDIKNTINATGKFISSIVSSASSWVEELNKEVKNLMSQLTELSDAAFCLLKELDSDKKDEELRKGIEDFIKNKQNPYEILGITPEATSIEIKKAYHEIIITHQSVNNNDTSEAIIKLQTIQISYAFAMAMHSLIQPKTQVRN